MLENYASAKLSGLADLRSSAINLDLDTLALNYKGFDIKNKEKLNLVFSLIELILITLDYFIPMVKYQPRDFLLQMKIKI